MKASPHNIWQIPAYMGYVHPELTNEAIAEAERKIGFPLPQSYIDLLKVQNGGYIRYTIVEGEHERIYGIGDQYPTITSFPTWEEIGDELELDVDRLIPFDGDNVHWCLCLDYRESNTLPSVAYVEIIEEYAYQIASSFDDYLDKLFPSDEFNFYIPQVDNLENLLSVISASLFLDFRAGHQDEIGHPIYIAWKRLKYKERIVIEPNLVPTGIVYENDPNYEATKNRFSGTKSRVINIPESSYLLTVTPGLQSALVSICEKHSIDLKHLSGFREPSATS